MGKSKPSVVIAVFFLILEAGCSSPSSAFATRTMVSTWTQVPSETARITTNTPSGTMTPTADEFVPGDPTSTPLGEEITDADFLAGKAAHAAGEYETAIRYMQSFIANNPDSAPAHWYIGNSYFFLGDCEAGFPEIEKALEINPNYAMAWADHGAFIACLGDEEQGVKDLLKALSMDPSIAKAHHNLGVHYFELGAYQLAMEEYALALAIDPTRAITWAELGGAQNNAGYFEGCLDSTTTAINLDAELWFAYENRGLCNQNAGHLEAAIFDFETYLAHDPNDAIIWNNLGIARNDLGDFQGALDAINHSLSLDPEYAFAYINRGFVYLNLEEYQQAIRDETKAIELEPIPNAYGIRGRAYFWSGDYEKAIADLETAAILYPGYAQAHYYLALAHFKLGHYQDVLDSARLAIRFNSSYDHDQLLMETTARSSYALGDYESALLYINLAMGYGQFFQDFYYRGIINQAAGHLDDAIRDLEFFVSVEKNPSWDSSSYAVEMADAKERLKELQDLVN